MRRPVTRRALQLVRRRHDKRWHGRWVCRVGGVCCSLIVDREAQLAWMLLLLPLLLRAFLSSFVLLTQGRCLHFLERLLKFMSLIGEEACDTLTGLQNWPAELIWAEINKGAEIPAPEPNLNTKAKNKKKKGMLLHHPEIIIHLPKTSRARGG